MVCLNCCISNDEPEKLKRRKIDRLTIGFPQDFRHINHVGSGDTSNNTSMSSLTQRLQDVDSDHGNVSSCGLSPLLLNCIDLSTTQKTPEPSESISPKLDDDQELPQEPDEDLPSPQQVRDVAPVTNQVACYRDPVLTRNWVSVTDLPPPPVPPVVDDGDCIGR